jgi:glucokinase
MKAAKKAVGIDIGGSKIAVAAVGEDGSIESSVALATEAAAGFSRAMERIARAVKMVLSAAGWQEAEICGIGLGCAGPVDSFRGIIHNPYTLPGWEGCDIVQPLRERFNTPVFLENDADTAALGEHLAGAGRGRNPVAMLTFGTGVGGALLCNGRIQRGVNGEHPELGHMLVSTDGPECYCGARGCLESLASGSAIAAAGRACGLPDAQAVFAEARTGGVKAKAIIDSATNAVAVAAWNLCHTFLPQRLILGGGIMEHHYGLFEPVINQRLRTATQFSREAVDIAQAALGNNAGVVGAASLAFCQGQPATPGSRSTVESVTTQIAH